MSEIDEIDTARLYAADTETSGQERTPVRILTENEQKADVPIEKMGHPLFF